MGVRSADVPYNAEERRLRAHVRKLNEELDTADSPAEVDPNLAVTLRCETMPALLLVGYEPHDSTVADFGVAVKSLVALRHVDYPKPWGPATENEALADAVIDELERRNLITPGRAKWLSGELTPEQAAEDGFSNDAAIRCSAIVRLFTERDPEIYAAIRCAITTQSTRNRITTKLLLDIAASLILRSLPEEEPRRRERTRKYLKEAFGQELIKEDTLPWRQTVAAVPTRDDWRSVGLSHIPMALPWPCLTWYRFLHIVIYGVPWDMRVAANRLNIEQAILDGRRELDQTQDPNKRDAVQRRIGFYQGLLSEVPDPTGRPGRVQRQILAFDPARSSLVELIGDLGTAKNVGVLVPGMNTNIEGSAANTETAKRFVQAAHGDLAMITYLGGPFPQGGVPDGIDDAMDTHYATDMAPRLVSFSEDVNRVVDTTGRGIAVSYLGHSYGGSVLGTAEAMGLTADRTIYVEAAGAGVGVDDLGDWHNENPNVMRYSMTAPGDWIEPLQGMPFNPHGADPDEMDGVIHLATGDYDDGRRMAGVDTHSDVLNEPSDAWRNILAVMTGQPYSVDVDPIDFLPQWARPPWLRLTG